MTIDWSRVNLEHVQQACELYASGTAVPRRPAKSTFLLLNGKFYPAKFIRGLAYRLATGIELDPNREYSGGLETVRFFQSLGLATRHNQFSEPVESTAVPTLKLPITDEEPPGRPKEHREPQKRALAELLRCRCGPIEMETEFPWLTIPQPEQMDETICSIFHALQTMRGFIEFITPGKSLKCDFFLPSERVIIEYDERQHFTMQRAKALELYSAELPLGFDREEWITTCQTIQATDPTPPYRDEQRAFYDSLRDILAARNAFRLIRFRYGTQDWTAPGASKILAAFLSGTIVTAGPPPTLPAAQASLSSAENKITRIALVSHDYTVPDSEGRYDYSEHFSQINRHCDEQGCDTILYALYTWDEASSVPRTHGALFKGLNHVQRIILEVGQPPDSFDHVEVWQRMCKAPLVAKQRFATSTAPGSDKEQFVQDLPQRRIQDALLVLCGESNIASLVRGSDEFNDPYRFAHRLREMNVQVVFNPIHDYMRRYEMREKRRYYSQGGRTVISVWNQGKGKESYLPWTVFHDGEERTAAVRELARLFSDRPDIRIGVLDLPGVS